MRMERVCNFVQSVSPYGTLSLESQLTAVNEQEFINICTE